MGSIITNLPGIHDISSLFGAKKTQKVFMQFTPGIVGSVGTSNESGIVQGDPTAINSILALCHYDESTNGLGDLDERNRYYPLMRGIVDCPVPGDPVLLCTIGNRQYYLGPLNTTGNPNFNFDYLYNPRRSSKKRSGRDKIGLSKNFKTDSTSTFLQKRYDEDLDNPGNKQYGDGPDELNFRDIHGDMVLEGRHGNAIRIGSRHKDPSIMISNNRKVSWPYEGIMGNTKCGSLIGMFTRGSLRQHFREDRQLVDGNPDTPAIAPFILASDTIENGILISQLVGDINETNTHETQIIYDYGKTAEAKDQILQTSERITINANTESIFMSAKMNVHIGAGNSLTISATNDIIFEGGNIYLGRNANKDISGRDEQGLVKGENLRAVLEHLVDILMLANGYCNGIPLPLGYKGSPVGHPTINLTNELSKIKTALVKGTTSILSKTCFVDGENQEYVR